MVINTNNGFNNANQTNTTRERNGIESNAKAPSSNAKDGATAANMGDKVMLSSEAKSFGKLSAAVAQAPEVDSEKVANIKKAIAEGKFEVNPERIAAKMLQQEDLFS
ncbi:flagellar biosynthesis anti-sigma factor FlgM [uncultured Pseudoteredinibacter sp.]|uniref:flagellar biosynthesis anti-sigma factor FlgM n=1 Tax=uncultured Pseudoteredinibacter sp. TaxID=1641701 RepID=UPI0026039CEC|nr:flagellar biosynthesis anti-sigma factor FlgM [uncultured Pseudoteredinibacter sp.]